MAPVIRVIPTHGPEAEAIHTALRVFNTEHANRRPRQLFTLFCQNDENQDFSGVVAYVHWDVLRIEAMWVGASMRFRGLGRSLLATAETEGLKRGAQYSCVETFSWQARPFYEKSGYTLLGQIPYVNGTENLFILGKKLK